MHHQGRIVVNGENFNGTGYFKFYIGSLDDQFEWSNDNSSLGSDEPNTAVPVTVTNGHYSVPLGDTTFHANMNNPIPASGFADKDELYLHVWFSTDNSTFERLLPDRRLATSAYAFSAAEINGGSVKNPSFVGTTGNTAMDVTINGLRAMRFQPGNLSDDLRFPSPAGPGEGTVSIVGGYEGNSIAAGVDGATISGGGGVFVDEFVQFQLSNTIGIFAHFSTISGGRENEISAAYGTIGGGRENQVSDRLGTVSGGERNIAGDSASVGGGRNNQATGRRATIPGGDDNRATGRESFAAGRGAQALHDSTFVWADSNGVDSVVPFASTAAEQFLIRAGGGVGIGTNAPADDLHVNTDNVGEGIRIRVETAGDNFSGFLAKNSTDEFFMGVSNELWQLYDNVGLLSVITAQSGGPVGINADSVDNALVVTNINAGDNTDGIQIKLGPVSNVGTSHNYLEFLDGDGTFIGQVEGNGSGGVAYNTTSDRRLKDDITDLPDALAIVQQLQPREFVYRTAPDIRQAGFIAQEVAEVYPQAASGDPDVDVDDEPMMVDYSAFTPVLTGAVKQLHALIQSQQAELEALRESNEIMRERLDRLEARPEPATVAGF
jgi:hypothetical protein